MRTATHNFIHSEATSKMKKATGYCGKESSGKRNLSNQCPSSGSIQLWKYKKLKRRKSLKLMLTLESSSETRGSQPWDINRLNKETNHTSGSSVTHVSIPTQSSSSPTGKQRGGERATKLTSNINDTECTNSDSTKICSNSMIPNAHKILANSTRVNHMRLAPHKM